MDDSQTKSLLESSKNVLVIGLSKDEFKAAHQIPLYLFSKGYAVAGVNPTVTSGSVAGMPVYPSLDAVPPGFSPDIIVVFRPSEQAGEAVRRALEKRPAKKAVWLQLGIKSEQAGQLAESMGLAFVQDKCMMVEHKRLFGV
ncbi:MAG TPA: CoA-binding protein [Candidatus Micrarchaeota archaeon]|nr:CoA-binding protein [Candidatus Micrarchaeota archaeon]